MQVIFNYFMEMKLSRKSEYACLSLIELAKNYEDDGLITTGELAERNDIPRKYLEQILLTLKGTGFVKSVRGVGGGYKLAKSPDKISLADIIRVIDGALAPVESVSKHFYDSSPAEHNNKLMAVFRDIRDYTANILEKTTFKDII